MICPDTTRLVALIEHVAPPTVVAELEQHLDSCDRCRKVVATAVLVTTKEQETKR